MSERGHEFHEQNVEDKPNLLKDFNGCLEVVSAIESQWDSQVGPKERDILRQSLGAALEQLEQKRQNISTDDLKKFEARAVTGFQGLGGFNRYIVRGNGTIGLTKSHSIEKCIR